MDIMNKNEMHEKYFEIFIERFKRFNLEKEIVEVIKKWLNEDSGVDNKKVQLVVYRCYKKIEELNEFEEKMYEEQLSNDNKNVSINHHLGFVPNNNTILDSSLSNENKTSEEFENEKNKLLDIIKQKLKNHEISLVTASELISDINVLYNFYDEDAKKI